MKTARWTLAVAPGLFGLATMALADEKKIAIGDLPKAVAKAAKTAFPEAKIVGAAQETEDGETMYEVMMKLDGKSIDLAIDDEGEIEEVEKEIEVEDLPRAVIKAARAKFANGKIAKVEEVSDEDDNVVYELTIETKGEEAVEVVFSPNGKVKEATEEEEEDDKPKAKKKEKDDDDDEDDKPKAKKKEKDDDMDDA